MFSLRREKRKSGQSICFSAEHSSTRTSNFPASDPVSHAHAEAQISHTHTRKQTHKRKKKRCAHAPHTPNRATHEPCLDTDMCVCAPSMQAKPQANTRKHTHTHTHTATGLFACKWLKDTSEMRSAKTLPSVPSLLSLGSVRAARRQHCKMLVKACTTSATCKWLGMASNATAKDTDIRMPLR